MEHSGVGKYNMIDQFKRVLAYPCAAIFVLILLSGCGSAKFLDEGETFLKDNDVKLKNHNGIRNKGQIKEDLTSLYQQEAT